MNRSQQLLGVAYFTFTMLFGLTASAQSDAGNVDVILLSPDGTKTVVEQATVAAFDVMTGDILNRTMYDGTLSPQVAEKMADLMNTLLTGDQPDTEKIQKVGDLMQDTLLEDLKIKLKATDDEWAVLLPKIKKLIAARNNIPSSADFTDILNNQTPARKVAAELKNLLNNSKASSVAITAKLREYRQVSRQANEEFASAGKDVAQIVTPWQEATLVDLGYMK